jgi:surface antigen
MLLFTAETPTITSPLIQTVIEIQTPQVVEPEPIYTIEDKIAMNYYGCDESIEWIRADTAECIPKRVNTPQNTQSAVLTAVRTSNGASAPSGYYKWGWCTYGAWSLTGWAGAWGDAKFWADNAHRDGHTVSSKPIVGSIFVDRSGSHGHVGVVTAVSENTITVKDMNYSGFGQWTTRTVSASGLVYIYP